MRDFLDRPVKIYGEPNTTHYLRLLRWLFDLRIVPKWYEDKSNILTKIFRSGFYDGLTLLGKGILLLCITLFFLSFQFKNSFSLFTSSLGISFIFFSVLAGKLFKPKIKITRESTDFAICGEKFISKVRVKNTGKRELLNFSVREVKSFNAKWPLENDCPYKSSLPVSCEAYFDVEFNPEKRGVVKLHGIAVQTYFPFYLTRTITTVMSKKLIYILPGHLDVNLPSIKKMAEKAVSFSSAGFKKGKVDQSLEYEYSRKYQTGDSLKRLDHKASSRIGEPMSKIFCGADISILSKFFIVFDCSLKSFKDWQPKPLSSNILDDRLSLLADVVKSAKNDGMLFSSICWQDEWSEVKSEKDFLRQVVECEVLREKKLPESLLNENGIFILITGCFDDYVEKKVKEWRDNGQCILVFLLPEEDIDKGVLPDDNGNWEIAYDPS